MEHLEAYKCPGKLGFCTEKRQTMITFSLDLAPFPPACMEWKGVLSWVPIRNYKVLTSIGLGSVLSNDVFFRVELACGYNIEPATVLSKAIGSCFAAISPSLTWVLRNWSSLAMANRYCTCLFVACLIDAATKFLMSL